MDFGRAISVVAFENINFQTFSIASYLTEPVDYWMKVTKVSCNEDSLLGIFGEVSGRDYISWKFRFPNYIHFDLDSCSKNKDSCLGLIFEKTYDGLLFS